MRPLRLSDARVLVLRVMPVFPICTMCWVVVFVGLFPVSSFFLRSNHDKEESERQDLLHPSELHFVTPGRVYAHFDNLCNE